MPGSVVILCTCGTEAEAEGIARQLVNRRLAACVNIIAPIRSVYRWQGKIESASEWMLMIKTEASRFEEIAAAIQAMHSYEVPEVIALPVAAGSQAYLNWIGDSVSERQYASKVRALIFDMDGVIVNSNPLHRDAWVAYNRRHNLETTEAMHTFMYGKRNDAIVRDFYGAALSDAEVFEHGAAKEALYREMMRPLLKKSLVPGLREFIERHADLAIGVGTNAEPENVKFVLDEAGLGPLFHAVVDGHQVARAKPAPDIYLKVASLLGAEPEACVVFEDSFSGVEAARAAGMRVVGIRTTHQEFADVDLAIDDFLDPRLEEWLQSVG